MGSRVTNTHTPAWRGGYYDNEELRLHVLALQGPEHEELDGFLLGLVEPLVAAVLHHADEQEEAKSEEMRAIVLRKRHKLRPQFQSSALLSQNCWDIFFLLMATELALRS